MKKIAFTVNKGGVGKTTSVCAIAQILAIAEYRVLLVDIDPQANTSRIFGVTEDIKGVDYEDLYCRRISKTDMEDFIVPTNFKNIDIIPSSVQMIDMDVKLYDAKKENPEAELSLKRNLAHIEELYDFILMDNAPAINRMSNSSIAASDMILIPINTDNLSFEGINLTVQSVQKINDAYDLSVKFGGIFMTRVKNRTTLYKDLCESYETQMGDYFIEASIKDCNAVSEANTAFIPLYQYAKKCTAFIDYVKLISQLDIMDKEHYQNVVEQMTNKKPR